MDDILGMISSLGLNLILITPFTLIIGIINSLKKPIGQCEKYVVVAIISAYLIIVPMFHMLNRLGQIISSK